MLCLCTYTRSYTAKGIMAKVYSSGYSHSNPRNHWSEKKKLASFRLTEAASSHLQRLADIHGCETKTEVLEELARPDGRLVAVPRELLELWQEEAKKATTSPRWQRAKELLLELEEYMPQA
jgi:hypothetical protein